MILIIFLYSVAILSEWEYINTTQLNLKHNLDVNRAIVRRFNEIRECAPLSNVIYFAMQDREFKIYRDFKYLSFTAFNYNYYYN